MKQNVILFYHCVDVDGTSSAAMMKYYLERNMLNIPGIKSDDVVNVKLKPWNYGFKLSTSTINKEDIIFLLDIHFPEEELIRILDVVEDKVYILDHHESSFELLNKYKKRFMKGSMYSDQHSACMHVYNFVSAFRRDDWNSKELDRFSNLKFLYTLFELWDIHTYVNLKSEDDYTPQNIINMTYYLNSIQNDPSTVQGLEFWDDMFDKVWDEDTMFQQVREFFDVGEIIYQSLQKRFVSDLTSYSFSVNFEGHKMLCANKYPGEGSSYFAEWDTRDYDLLCHFYFSGKSNHWVFGIVVNENKDVNLLPIWKKFNHIRAGGHSKVGAFRCTSFKYNKDTQEISFEF